MNEESKNAIHEIVGHVTDLILVRGTEFGNEFLNKNYLEYLNFCLDEMDKGKSLDEIFDEEKKVS